MRTREQLKVSPLYQLLLQRANGKRYFPRSVLRTCFEIHWHAKNNENTDKHWKANATSDHIRKAMNCRLSDLEKVGLIRRLDRAIEILENA